MSSAEGLTAKGACTSAATTTATSNNRRSLSLTSATATKTGPIEDEQDQVTPTGNRQANPEQRQEGRAASSTLPHPIGSPDKQRHTHASEKKKSSRARFVATAWITSSHAVAPASDCSSRSGRARGPSRQWRGSGAKSRPGSRLQERADRGGSERHESRMRYSRAHHHRDQPRCHPDLPRPNVRSCAARPSDHAVDDPGCRDGAEVRRGNPNSGTHLGGRVRWTGHCGWRLPRVVAASSGDGMDAMGGGTLEVVGGCLGPKRPLASLH